jgi:hypothetical protein
MKLVCSALFEGIMACWEEVPEATQYVIKLYFGDKLISVKTNERTELYHSFKGLPSGKFSVQIEAEGRDGKVLKKSEKVISQPKGIVRVFATNYF